MFKQLKLKLTVTYISLFTGIFILIFTCVYGLTNQIIKQQSLDQLNMLVRQYGSMNPAMKRSLPLNSFTLHFEHSKKEVSVTTLVDTDHTLINDALTQLPTLEASSGIIVLQDIPYRYMIHPTPTGYSAAFLDRSSELNTLNTLSDVLCFMGILGLILFSFASRFLVNKALKPIHNAWEKQQQFVADASHELRTPLAVIQANLDVLLPEASSSQARWMQYIKEESKRMTTLVEQLLYLAKVDTPTAQLPTTQVALSDLVYQVALPFEALLFESQIALTVDIQDHLSLIGYEDQLKQLLLILLDNAKKYTPTGGNIVLRLYKKHKRIVLEITNTGQGIAPEHLEKLFDRFYRVDKSRSRKQGSYGLGLSIAKTIVLLHKGTIKVTSIPNRSTTFTISF